MKSKTSCFNKTIFKKNLTLYWPIWVAYLLYMVASVPVSLYQYMQNYLSNPSVRQYSALRSVFDVAAEPTMIFIFLRDGCDGGIFLSLYSEEYKRNPRTSGDPIRTFCYQYCFSLCIFSIFRTGCFCGRRICGNQLRHHKY